LPAQIKGRGAKGTGEQKPAESDMVRDAEASHERARTENILPASTDNERQRR